MGLCDVALYHPVAHPWRIYIYTYQLRQERRCRLTLLSKLYQWILHGHFRSTYALYNDDDMMPALHIILIRHFCPETVGFLVENLKAKGKRFETELAVDGLLLG